MIIDFTYYARKRDLLRTQEKLAKSVAEIITNIDKPGSVQNLKTTVVSWLNKKVV